MKYLITSTEKNSCSMHGFFSVYNVHLRSQKKRKDLDMPLKE